MSRSATIRQLPGDADLVRRVNRHFHDATQASFDDDHRARHRVERVFWNHVGRAVLGRARHAGGVDDRGPRTVVDLACGTGFVGRTLAAWMRPQDRLVCIDISEAAVRSATAAGTTAGASTRCPGGVSGFTADGASLPLADESVDLIALNASLHHVPDPLAALCEIDRVLAPGGTFAMGFEPNRRFFDSTVLPALARTIDRLGWYVSPRQNRRRLARCLGSSESASVETDEQRLAAAVNQRLLREGRIDQPLSTGAVLDLVDPHARNLHGTAGFDLEALISGALGNYHVCQLVCSDYLGETTRRCPVLRSIVDGVLRQVAPRRGSLFSWVVRKPHSPGGGSHAV